MFIQVGGDSPLQVKIYRMLLARTRAGLVKRRRINWEKRSAALEFAAMEDNLGKFTMADRIGKWFDWAVVRCPLLVGG